MTDIIDRLRGAGEATVRASAMIAEAKTVRNVAAGDEHALYLGLSFEETTEAAAIREIEDLRDTAQKRRMWLREAKWAEGYDDDTSFDDVWANLRAERDRLKKALEDIAEYSSGDDANLGALHRLISIRNTARQAIQR